MKITKYAVWVLCGFLGSPVLAQEGQTGAEDPAAGQGEGAAPPEQQEGPVEEAGEEVDDAMILTQVKSQLALEEDVDANAVNVTVNEGVVTLSGRVSSAAAEERALDIARNTEGAVKVVDKLKVSQPSPGQ